MYFKAGIGETRSPIGASLSSAIVTAITRAQLWLSDVPENTISHGYQTFLNTMNRHFDYTGYNIRDDLPTAYRKAWELIARPGFWWTGAEKVLIAEECRNALSCKLCDERKRALSPNSVHGEHLTSTSLPDKVVDAAHRVTRDASRLSQTWLDTVFDENYTDAHYVEMLGVVVAVISIDNFQLGMGLSPEPLPTPFDGEPSHRRPANAKSHGAWIPTVIPPDVDPEDADIYGGMEQTGNVLAAMSLVPDAVRLLNILGEAQYLAPADVTNPGTNGGRALSRPQIEFVAGRVSAHNECFY